MEIILHLGGNARRAQTAAALAAQFPNSHVVISSEGGGHGLSFYKEAGISQDRITVDMQAWDTVTNFTHTYKLLRQLEVTRLYVVTDSSHMPRAMAIANMVWGFRVPVIPYPYQDNDAYRERDAQYIRFDRFRALLWRLTGILIYHKSVRERRQAHFTPSTGNAWFEVGI